jgi:hypothetical protein
MKYIETNKLIQLLTQTKDKNLSLKNVEALFEIFADDYFAEGCNMVLTKKGKEIDPNTIYKMNWI